MRQTGEFMDLEPGFDIYLCRDGYICLSELALTIGEMKAAPNVSVGCKTRPVLDRKADAYIRQF